MNMKQFIPASIRLYFKLLCREVKDKRLSVIFAQKKPTTPNFSFSISDRQTIRQANYYQNKVNNIKLGAKFIQEIVIEPGQTISFWKAIGKPIRKRGFKIGRNLINEKLTADYGGGLCQLSGILYITSLKAGLTITERHNHTKDIYTEEERFTPLGSDAAVVYGYKDLRIKNTFTHPIQFVFTIEDNSIECRLTSPQKIDSKDIHFIKTVLQESILVESYRDDVLCDVSQYTH